MRLGLRPIQLVHRVRPAHLAAHRGQQLAGLHEWQQVGEQSNLTIGAAAHDVRGGDRAASYCWAVAAARCAKKRCSLPRAWRRTWLRSIGDQPIIKPVEPSAWRDQRQKS